VLACDLDHRQPLVEGRGERLVLGRRPRLAEVGGQALAAALARDFAPISDMRASARYRTAVARNLLSRFFRSEALAPAGAHVLRYGT
jgi:xanthine dehydrogenase small subunit